MKNKLIIIFAIIFLSCSDKEKKYKSFDLINLKGIEEGINKDICQSFITYNLTDTSLVIKYFLEAKENIYFYKRENGKFINKEEYKKNEVTEYPFTLYKEIKDGKIIWTWLVNDPKRIERPFISECVVYDKNVCMTYEFLPGKVENLFELNFSDTTKIKSQIISEIKNKGNDSLYLFEKTILYNSSVDLNISTPKRSSTVIRKKVKCNNINEYFILQSFWLDIIEN